MEQNGMVLSTPAGLLKNAQSQTESAPGSASIPTGASPRAYVWIAIALAVIFFCVTLSESLLMSPTSDEPPHIASGLSYVSTGIFRGNLQHPPLLKELSGLSQLLGGIRWPRNPETESFLRGDYPKGTQPDWEIGHKLLVNNGLDRTLFWARLPFLLIASLLAILIYFWGRQMVGGLAGLCAAFLYVTDPTILGLGYTVTMDVGLTAFTVLFLFVLWRYLCNPTPARLVFCGIELGLVLCVKFSALLLLPAAGLLLLAAVIWPPEADPERKRNILDPYYIEPKKTQSSLRSSKTIGRNDPCPCGSGKKYKLCHAGANLSSAPGSSLYKRWMLCAAALLAMCLIAAVVIETLYFFPQDPLLYVHGAQLVNADHYPDYLTYMAGELQHRFTGYFAVAYLLKEPMAGILLALGGLVLLFRSKSITPLHRLFLLVPPAIFFIGTSIMAEQIGIRYILPVLPFAHLLGGMALAALFTSANKWGRWVAVASCAWLALAVAGTYPDYLPYFNESACLLRDPAKIGLDGGSKCGALWLDESNVDWGQSAKQLKLWLDRHAKGRTIRFFTPGYSLFLDDYGIPHDDASMVELGLRPFPALYVVSARQVARIPAIPETKKWLRETPPTALVGHALYVYDIKALASSP